MLKNQNQLNNGAIPLLVIVLFLINIFNYNKRQNPPLDVSKDISEVNFNPRVLKTFSLGLNRFISALIWTDSIQSLENYRSLDRTKRSWFYHRIKTVLELNPNNPDAYYYGPILLSFVVDDVIGADEIFKKSSKLFPDNFWINYYYAFNLYFELGKHQKGIAVFKKLLEHPSVKEKGKWRFLHGLVARFEASKGNLKEAFQTLYIFYQMQNDEKIKQGIRRNLYSIKAEIDLTCLNKNQERCHLNDFEGQPYIKTPEGKWEAKKSWKKYRKIKQTYQKKGAAN